MDAVSSSKQVEKGIYFKNPYDTGEGAVRSAGASHTTNDDLGYVNLVVDATNTDLIKVTTCFQDDTGGELTGCAKSTDTDTTDIVVNSIIVGE